MRTLWDVWRESCRLLEHQGRSPTSTLQDCVVRSVILIYCKTPCDASNDQLFVRRAGRPPAASISGAGLARPRRCMIVHLYAPFIIPCSSAIIECPPLLTVTMLSTAHVDNKYGPDIKWPTKVKWNHPRPLDTRSARWTNSNKTALGARYEIALNYVQLTRVIFHYYDSILASHNRAGVVTWRAVSGDHYPSITLHHFFAELTATPMRGKIKS